MSHRKDVTTDLSHGDHVDLAQQIMNFLHDNLEIIHEHMAIVGSQSNPSGMGHEYMLGEIPETGATNTRELHHNLWHGHRFYISKLEDYLIEKGWEKFVPLPKWDAEQKIPRPLSVRHSLPPHEPGEPPGIDIDINFDVYNGEIIVPERTEQPTIPGTNIPVGPPVTIPEKTILLPEDRPKIRDERLLDENIGNIPSAVRMAGLITPYHFEVHLKLGGVMTDPHHASSCALFWVWHAALEEFYHKWTLRKLDKCKGLIVGTNADGRLEAFVIGNDNNIWRSYQWWRYGGWSYWESLGGSAKQIVVEQNMSGQLELIAIDMNDRVAHNLQGPGDPEHYWGIWGFLGEMTATEIAVGKNHDGRLELFAIDSSHKLWHNAQDTTATWGSWEPLAQDKDIAHITVGRHRSGVLEVYAIGTDTNVWSIYQMRREANSWSGWGRLSEQMPGFKQLIAAHGNDFLITRSRGKMMLFGVSLPFDITTGGIIPGSGPRYAQPSRVYIRPVPDRVFQSSSGIGMASATSSFWTRFRATAVRVVQTILPGFSNPWKSLGRDNVRKIAIGLDRFNKATRLFALGELGEDGRLWYTQKLPLLGYDLWTRWADQSIENDVKLEDIAVARNDRFDPPTEAYGRLPTNTIEVFAKVRDDVMWHKWLAVRGWSRWQLF